jgi:hypothetical protein
MPMWHFAADESEGSGPTLDFFTVPGFGDVPLAIDPLAADPRSQIAIEIVSETLGPSSTAQRGPSL